MQAGKTQFSGVALEYDATGYRDDVTSFGSGLKIGVLLRKSSCVRSQPSVKRIRNFTTDQVSGDMTAAFDKVRGDKQREADDGFDGSWVAHPGMVGTCLEVFDAVLGERPNQVDRTREDVTVTAADLLAVKDTPGKVTEQGLRANIDVGVQYLATWLTGRGAVGIHNLMEDAATAEISRSQVWQWIHNGVTLADTGETVTRELVQRLIDEVVAELPGDAADYREATELFTEMALSEDYADFLTVPAYEAMP